MTRPAALLLLLLAGCFVGDHPEEPLRLGRMGKLFGGKEGLDVVEFPEKVEAYRLRAPDGMKAVQGYNRWPTVGPAVRVKGEAAARFSHGLTRESTYPRWDEPKACDPRPGFMLRFYGDGRSVDVVFCFECKILFTYRASESIWYANFDGSTKALATTFLQVYPDDPDLKALAAAAE